MKQRSLYRVASTKNEFNEDIQSFVFVKHIDVAISLNTKQSYLSNDSNIMNCEYIGVTSCPDCQKGMKIDDYVIDFVQETKRNYFLSLKEVDNNGRVSI